MNRKAAAILAVKAALSVALLALVLSKVDAASVVEVLAKADPWLVSAWYLLVPVMIALSAWRWECLAPGIDFWTSFKYTWIGMFYGHVLPGSIAGDVAKGVSLALKDASAREGLAASIVADKVIGLAVLVAFFDVACAIVYALHGESAQIRQLALLAIALSVGGLVAAGVGAAIALKSKLFAARGREGRVGRFAEKIGDMARYYANKRDLLAKAVFISVLIHLVNIFAMYLSFRALRIDASLVVAAIVYPVVSVILVVPISISGIGVRDAVFAVLFTIFGMPAASGVATSWLALLAVIPNVAIGASVQLLEMYRKR